MRILANQMYGTLNSHQFYIPSSTFHSSDWPKHSPILPHNHHIPSFLSLNHPPQPNQVKLKMATVSSFRTSHQTISTAFKMPKNTSCLKIQNSLCKVVITDQLLQPHIQFQLGKILLWFVLVEGVFINLYLLCSDAHRILSCCMWPLKFWYAAMHTISFINYSLKLTSPKQYRIFKKESVYVYKNV